jgi:hypothetical protein
LRISWAVVWPPITFERRSENPSLPSLSALSAAKK